MSRYDSVRRLVGTIFLTMAVGMLVLGETVWAEGFNAYQFLLYWSTCSLFTLLSVFIAVYDGLRVLKVATHHHTQLKRHTVEEVERWTKQRLSIH